MPKHKMITKSCPKCLQQLPVACKTCQCGHLFFIARRAGTVSESDVITQRRRTERVKREKPNYYDSLEYDKQSKRKRKMRNNADYNEQKGEEAINERHTLKKKRKRSFKPNNETEKDSSHMFTPENGYKLPYEIMMPFFEPMKEIRENIGSSLLLL